MTRQRSLSAVVAGLAIGVLIAANPAPVAAATSDQMSAAAGAAKHAAREFLQRSGCPLTFKGAKAVGQVTKTNRSKVVKAMIKDALLAKGFNGSCKAVGGIPSGASAKAKARYRSTVRNQVTVGKLLVRLSWRDDAGKKHQTLAVVSKHAKLTFESLMASYARPAPAQVPMPPEARTSARSQPSAPVLSQSWAPWGQGTRCVIRNGMGWCSVSKSVTLKIDLDESGKIISFRAPVSVTARMFFDAGYVATKKIFFNGRCECLKVTVNTRLANIFDEWVASNGQAYTLCADGTTEYIGGVAYQSQ